MTAAVLALAGLLTLACVLIVFGPLLWDFAVAYLFYRRRQTTEVDQLTSELQRSGLYAELAEDVETPPLDRGKLRMAKMPGRAKREPPLCPKQ